MAPDQHADGPRDIGDGCGEAGLHVGQAEPLDDLRDKDGEPDTDPRLAEMDRSERQHAPVDKGLQHREAPMLGERPLLFLHFALEPCLLVGGEPPRLGRPVGQVEEADHPEEDRRGRLTKEQPLPAGQTKDAVEFEEPRRYRGTEPDRYRDRRHKAGDDARAMQRREPIGEIEDHAGEEAGLGETERKPQDEEADRPLGEREGARNQAPADHDAANPTARPDLLEDQIARHLENKITPEKGAGAKPEDIRAEPDILVHGQCGKPDVHAIEIADEIKYEAKRQ